MSMRPPRSVLRCAGLSAVIVAGLLAPATAHAAAADAPGENLLQVIDPNQAQGTGQVVLERGHVDFGPTLNTGEWIIQAHDDTASPSYWRHLEDVVMRVNDASVLEVPDAAAYDFLGQEPRTPVWVIPQTRNNDVIWTGWNTQEPTVLDRLDLGTTLTVHGVEGPGEVTVYLQSGNFGDPDPLWSTLQPFPQQSWIEVNTHTHANWVFTAPGIYLVDVEFSADLNTGESVSARDTLRFAVGDATVADDAFGMVLTAPADTSDPTADPGGPPMTDTTDAASDNGLSTLIWIVVGAVAVALAGAIVVIVTSSRRARRRALAARAERGPAR